MVLKNSKTYLLFIVTLIFLLTLKTNPSYIMTKILFPSDFSKTAKNAYLYALTMARALDAEIVVLHSFLIPLIDESGIPANFKEVFDMMAVQNQERLDDHMLFLNKIARTRGFQDIETKAVLKSGDLHLAMAQVVEQEGIELVVMGTSGTTGWFESILGSQTSDAIASLSVPVMSVPLGLKFSKINTIAFANLYREKDFVALQRLCAMIAPFESTIKSIFVKKPNSDVTAEEIAIWESRCTDLNVQFFVIPDDNVRATIDDFINSQHIDLLAMLTEKRGFFQELFSSSLTQKLSNKLDIPILAFHEPDLK